MAKKVNLRAGKTMSVPPARRRWPLFAGLGVAAACGVVLAFWIHPRPQFALPEPPNLIDRPADLRARLTEAQTNAAWQPTLATVAELGRLYHANGFATRATVCWRYLHAAQPREAHWTYYLADLAQSASDTTAMAQWLERTVALAPDYAPAWLQLGEFEFKSGQLDAAEHAYRRRLALVPHDPYAALGLARIALQHGQRADGKRQLEALLQATPNFSSARNIYAELLAQENDTAGAARERWLGTVAGRFRAADDPWKEALRPYCYDPDQWIVWGETDFQTKHGDLGRRALERAFRLAPDSPRAIEKLGRFYLDSDEPGKARDLLEKICQSPGTSEVLFAELSEAYMGLHDPARALDTADRGLTQTPDSANLYNARGLALASAGRTDEAIAAYHAAIKRAPGTPNAVANLGLVLLMAKRRDEAVAQLQQALRLQPGYTKAVVALATIELDAGNLSAAAEYVLPFYREFPGTGTAQELVSRYYSALALAAARKGDLAAIERICHEGLALAPESAELHGFLALHYLHHQQFPEAIENLEAAHRDRPGDPRAIALLGQVYAQVGRIADARKLLSEGAELARQRGDAATAGQLEAVLSRLTHAQDSRRASENPGR